MLAPTSYPATGGPPRPLDGGVQQAQLLAGRRLLADLAGAHAVHARQEAVHAVHTPRVPHLPAARQGPVGFTDRTRGQHRAFWYRVSLAQPRSGSEQQAPCHTYPALQAQPAMPHSVDSHEPPAGHRLARNGMRQPRRALASRIGPMNIPCT